LAGWYIRYRSNGCNIFVWLGSNKCIVNGVQGGDLVPDGMSDCDAMRDEDTDILVMLSGDSGVHMRIGELIDLVEASLPEDPTTVPLRLQPAQYSADDVGAPPSVFFDADTGSLAMQQPPLLNARQPPAGQRCLSQVSCLTEASQRTITNMYKRAAGVVERIVARHTKTMQQQQQQQQHGGRQQQQPEITSDMVPALLNKMPAPTRLEALFPCFNYTVSFCFCVLKCVLNCVLKCVCICWVSASTRMPSLPLPAPDRITSMDGQNLCGFDSAKRLTGRL
jgi:hypothetical protein